MQFRLFSIGFRTKCNPGGSFSDFADSYGSAAGLRRNPMPAVHPLHSASPYAPLIGFGVILEEVWDPGGWDPSMDSTMGHEHVYRYRIFRIRSSCTCSVSRMHVKSFVNDLSYGGDMIKLSL